MTSDEPLQLGLEGMPRRLFACTPSRLQTWLDCPRRYRLTYVERPTTPRGQAWAHTTMGAAVHVALARWWSGPRDRRSPAGARTLLERAWPLHGTVPDGFADAAQSARWRQRAADMVERYAATLDPDDEPLGVERTVSTRTDGLLLSGRVDRVDVRDGELVVVDYKTGKGSGYDAIPLLERPNEEADLIDRGRKLQLVLYALAAQRHYSPPVRPTSSYYWFVELGAMHRGAPIGSQEQDRLLEVLDVAVRGIREGIYPAHPGEWDGWSGWDSCSFCPYDRACTSTRGEVWLQIRTADPVQAYAELTAGAKA